MSDWAEDQDPYEILGLAQGHESTEAQIKKVCLLSRSDTSWEITTILGVRTSSQPLAVDRRIDSWR